MGPAFPMHYGVFLLFRAEDLFSFFFPIFLGVDAGFTKWGGGAHPDPQRHQPCRPMWQGGGRRSKHWPPGAGDPRYSTAQMFPIDTDVVSITDASFLSTLTKCQ